ncbi:Calcineurin-binding protein 1 [Camellia lanceoleosa]|uniref:Calcineurin-binding protein 1 n=1 Tax=Camellia lanceoleosa TaxID=1840588 RepID=A0ACC0FKB3_9ERIC|nr:Calcineurin-binding protein 1 [Camellia lanceoleosa]
METRESFGEPCQNFAFQQRALEQGRDQMARFPQGMQIPQKDKLLKEDKLDRSSILEEDKLDRSSILEEDKLKFAGPAISDQIEQSQRCCFIDSAILICKLQHLNPVTQIELIVAMHYLLAEYGLFCAGGDGEIEEGTFLKLAIKHSIVLGYEA